MPAHKSDIFKYELLSVDNTVAMNIGNIFWGAEHQQLKWITFKVSLVIRRNKTRRKNYYMDATR